MKIFLNIVMDKLFTLTYYLFEFETVVLQLPVVTGCPFLSPLCLQA